MSGGVDSSVAAALLKYGDARLPAGRQGFDVVGIHMKMWSPQGSSPPLATGYQQDPVCQQQHQDRIDAMRAAAHLGIPFQTWDFSEAYRRAVVDYMIREYAAGKTPNPDVMCNSRIKFGAFLQHALALGADYIATGHYARLMRKSKILNPKSETNPKSQIQNYKLIAARDANKDQSYFLWTLTQDRLRHCLFPIGEYQKSEVRALARQFGLPNAEKPDSQGVCFIGEFNMREFLKNYIPERKGKVRTAAGNAVGEHEGAEFYTIGQRQGLGIGGGIPYYVADKDLASNTITVAEGPYDEKLFRKELSATDMSWVSGTAPKLPLHCEARIRYRQPVQPCRVERIMNQESRIMEREGIGSGSMIQNSNPLVHVAFTEPQRAVTAGQSVVFYRGGEMLGGGVIA